MNANVNEVKQINCQESFVSDRLIQAWFTEFRAFLEIVFHLSSSAQFSDLKPLPFFRTPTELWMENNNAVLFSRSLLLYPLFSPLWKKKMLNAFLQLLRWKDPNSRPIIRPTGVTASKNLGRKIRKKNASVFHPRKHDIHFISEDMCWTFFEILAQIPAKMTSKMA